MNDDPNYTRNPEPGYDPHTGEQLEPEIIPGNVTRERAADGGMVSTIAHTGGGFLDLLEDGNFSADAYDQMRELAAIMTDIHHATGNPTKGKITLEIELTKDGDAFHTRGKVSIKKPELPRPKSIMWTDSNNNFTRFPPNQTQMFGAPRAVRRV